MAQEYVRPGSANKAEWFEFIDTATGNSYQVHGSRIESVVDRGDHMTVRFNVDSDQLGAVADPVAVDISDTDEMVALRKYFYAWRVATFNGAFSYDRDIPEGGAGVTTFLELTDTPGTYSGQGGRVLYVDPGETLIAFGDLNTVDTFTDLSDTPADYSGAGGYNVEVNAGATALEFTPKPSLVTTFTGLTDTPSSYAGFEGYSVNVNTAGDGLEYQPKIVQLDQFTQLIDTPNSYAGAGGDFVRVNAGATALEYFNLSISRGSIWGTPNNGTVNTGTFLLQGYTGWTATGDVHIDPVSGIITLLKNGLWRVTGFVMGTQGNSNKEESMWLGLRANEGAGDEDFRAWHVEVGTDKTSDRSFYFSIARPTTTGTTVRLFMTATAGMGTFNFENAQFSAEYLGAT